MILLDVPLLLHTAWQMHAEWLLREYLLTRLAGENDKAELEAHAATHDAMALLREHITAPDLGPDPEELMSEATEPRVTAARLVVPVPVASLSHFARLQETLDAAERAADAGTLLTVPMQPELRRLRQWLCAQVREQASGGARPPG